MRRTTRSALLALLALLAFALPAAAATPTGSCPPAFMEADPWTKILDEFPQLDAVFGHESNVEFFEAVDANDDLILCWRSLPTNSRAFETRTLVVNVIDNKAAPHQ